MGKREKRILASSIVVMVMIANCLNLNERAVQADEMNIIEEDLDGLTVEQKGALSVLKLAEENEGLILNDSVDLESEEEVSVIVEFKEEPKSIRGIKDEIALFELFPDIAEGKIEEQHKVMEEHLDEMFKEESTKYIEESYTEVFNGMTINLPGDRVEELLDSDVVKAVYSNDIVKIEPVELSEVNNINNTSVYTSSTLGVEDLHAEGITGEGIKVAILDTGIDYNHPDLIDAYVGGYDFVDNDNDPMETTYSEWIASGRAEEDKLGNKYYTQHGTHIAGIVAGQGVGDSDFSVTGIAPGVEIYAYRVLGAYGSGYTSDILAGIDRAVEDGVDIINLSLGAEVNNHLYPTSIAVNNAVLNGVVAVVSSGNSGEGAYTVGSPGTSSLALTVGASTVGVEIESAKGILSNSLDEKYDLKLVAKNINENASNLDNVELEVVYIGNGLEVEYEGKDVEGKVVIINRGMDTLHNLVSLAKAKGAKAVLIHNNKESENHIPHYLGENSLYIPAFSISKTEGDLLVEKLNNNNNNKIIFTEFSEILEGEDRLASFSSEGPVKTSYDIKPEVVAPGVDINSTIPWFMDGLENESDYSNAYTKLNGTSMAAPYVAGVAALILQLDKSLEPLEVKSRIMNTSEELSEKYSVYEVGAGKVNPYNAVNSDINISVLGNAVIDESTVIDIYDGDLNFGLITANQNDYKGTRSIRVKNYSEDTKNFNIEVIENSRLGNSNDWSSNGVTVDILNEISVSSGTKEIDFTINIPSEASLGSYEGYIVLKNIEDENETYRVPFAIRKTQVVVGVKSYLGEGLSYNEGGIIKPMLGSEFDYSTLGIDIKIEDFEGNLYGTYYNDENNMFESKLELENKDYKLTFDIPGHFTVHRDFSIDKVDELYGLYYKDINFESALAGDVNKDNVIDIRDAIEIIRSYSDKSSFIILEGVYNEIEYKIGDINFDGVINEEDLYYVSKNYGAKNISVNNVEEPVLEIDGITLEDINEDIKDNLITLWLEKLIIEADKVIQSEYTEESYKKLELALKIGKDIAGNENSTQSDINSAEEELKNAIAELVKVDTNEEDKEEDSSEAGNNDGSENDSNNEEDFLEGENNSGESQNNSSNEEDKSETLPETGDISFIFLLGLSVFILILGIDIGKKVI